MISRTTWIVFAIFIALLVVLGIYQRNESFKEVKATPTSSPEALLEGEHSEIIALYLENDEGDYVELQLDHDGNWIFLEPKSVAVDTLALDSKLNQINSLRVLSRISPTPPKKDIGLDNPRLLVRLELVDGSKPTFYIGNITPTGSGFYVGTEQGEVLVVSKVGIDELNEVINTPPILEEVNPSSNP